MEIHKKEETSFVDLTKKDFVSALVKKLVEILNFL